MHTHAHTTNTQARTRIQQTHTHKHARVQYPYNHTNHTLTLPQTHTHTDTALNIHTQVRQLEAVIEALRNAKKPVIYAGGGLGGVVWFHNMPQHMFMVLYGFTTCHNTC